MANSIQVKTEQYVNGHWSTVTAPEFASVEALKANGYLTRQTDFLLDHLYVKTRIVIQST